MMSKKIKLGLGVATFLFGAITASGAVAKSIGIQLQVPVICRAIGNGAEAKQGVVQASLGSLDILCNAQKSFNVYLNHPGGEAAENIWFEFGGKRFAASRTGQTLLSGTDNPVRLKSALQLTASKPLENDFAVSVSTVGASTATKASSASGSTRKSKRQRSDAVSSPTQGIKLVRAIPVSERKTSGVNASLLPRDETSFFGIF
jgi:hypothetical protein